MQLTHITIKRAAVAAALLAAMFAGASSHPSHHSAVRGTHVTAGDYDGSPRP